MNTTVAKERMEWADIAKGIVFFVIMGHMPSIPEEIKLWIFSFHMPLFFYLSGYFAKPENLTVKVFILKKAKQLLIPYLVYSGIIILSDYLILGRGNDALNNGLIGRMSGSG